MSTVRWFFFLLKDFSNIGQIGKIEFIFKIFRFLMVLISELIVNYQVKTRKNWHSFQIKSSQKTLEILLKFVTFDLIQYYIKLNECGPINLCVGKFCNQKTLFLNQIFQSKYEFCQNLILINERKHIHFSLFRCGRILKS